MLGFRTVLALAVSVTVSAFVRTDGPSAAVWTNRRLGHHEGHRRTSLCPVRAAMLPLRMAAAAASPPPLSRQLVVEGMERFRNADIRGSIDSFDASVPKGYGNRPTYLWQRGISYYYANDFTAGSRQFREDVLSSPSDVEEIVWDIACLARLRPDEPFPPVDMLSLPPGKKDRRPIMSVVYDLFRGDATEEALATAGHGSQKPSDDFYSLLYLGLYNEVRGHDAKAESYMKAAAKSPYARTVGSRDYMVDVARVHCRLRNWDA